MTNDKMQPCLRRIDADCFRARPAWAKQALAYRIVHLLTPKPLTKRLPKGLRRALLAPGVEVPPGVEMPAGIVVSPGAEIPPGWMPSDPVPAGITIPPGAVFPPGWTPGDQVPEGVTVDPGATFPPGWTPGDLLPSGAIPPATYPPGVAPSETGPTPPAYVTPWSPGPVATGGAASYKGVWFYDPFTTLDLTVWAKTVTGTATITPVDGWMEFVITLATNVARLIHTHDTAVPDDCDISFVLNNTQNADYIYLAFDTANRSVAIKFQFTNQIHIWDGVQWQEYDGVAWKNSPYEWVLKERSGVLNVYRSLTHVVVNHAHATEFTTPGKLTIYARSQSVNKIDYLRIVGV